MEKDPMIKYRSVIRGKNSKGGDRTQLYLDTENATTLIETIQANLSNPKGVKIDLHISKKEYEGRTFDSAICFVKPVSDAPGFGAGASGPARAVPKATSDVQTKIQAMKAQALRT